MRKMKKWLALMVAGMMTVGLMGCSGSSDEGKKESGSDKADMKAAVVFGLGGLGDQSYNDLAYEGMERAKEELGVDYDYAEPKEVTDFETILRAMSDSNEYEVIIGVGFDSVDALASVAPDYPDQKYASIDSSLVGDNIVSYSCKEQEGSFLVGALAAYMKQDAATYGLEDNHKYGFVGALENDIINRFAAGYRAGIEYVDSDADVAIQYVGGDNPFGDTTTAKEIATTQKGKGYDIIFHAAGGSGLGVFTAAQESDFIAIGANSNQNIIDPDHIVASMLKRVDVAAYDIVKAALIQGGREDLIGFDEHCLIPPRKMGKNYHPAQKHSVEKKNAIKTDKFKTEKSKIERAKADRFKTDRVSGKEEGRGKAKKKTIRNVHKKKKRG